MSQTKVKKLTPEQAALIPVYCEKWRARSLSTGPINRSQAAETIKSAYSAIGKTAPEIIWQFVGFLHFGSKFTSFLRQKLDCFSIDCPGLRLDLSL
ncbi:hypothetical protein [Microcoleus sp. AT3-D2]|uniref:hypothetical protein n=1 Tax=Microcoleus sp. AT3-D2 TaxID=2818612 RepID=UPI002FD2F648